MIEDDIDDAYQQSRLLNSSEVDTFNIVTCTTSKDAIASLNKTTFDIVLCDLNLPDSTGIETIIRIISHAGKAPVIGLTNVDDDALGIAAVKAGAADYIPKSQLNGQFFLRTVKFCIERQLLLHKMQSQANIDDLTKLPNRYALMSRLEVLVNQSRRSDAKLALVYIDLDGFKLINDQYGHQSGDHVLKEISARIRTNLRKADFAARIGGDEFVLIITHYKSESDLITLIERKMKILNQPICLALARGEILVPLTASFGLTEFKEDMSIEEFIADADRNMYVSKKSQSLHNELKAV
jgi:diguanylate cyclase (GGDEF)-like protein